MYTWHTMFAQNINSKASQHNLQRSRLDRCSPSPALRAPKHSVCQSVPAAADVTTAEDLIEGFWKVRPPSACLLTKSDLIPPSGWPVTSVLWLRHSSRRVLSGRRCKQPMNAYELSLQARGVFDPHKRRQLVQLSVDLSPQGLSYEYVLYDYQLQHWSSGGFGCF